MSATATCDRILALIDDALDADPAPCMAGHYDHHADCPCCEYEAGIEDLEELAHAIAADVADPDDEEFPELVADIRRHLAA
jgi:hypothetical protein